MANWYGVYTRPRWEKKVAETLSRKRIENYCPLNRAAGSWSDRRKMLYEPVFTSYVFVRLNAMQLDELRKIEGVINLIYWMGKPAVIRDIEVEMMKRFLNEHKSIQLQKTPVNTSEIVKVINGHAAEEDTSGFSVNQVKLVLPSLGYMMIAEVARENVEVLLQDDVIQYDASLLRTN